MQPNVYHYTEPFTLESGKTLPELHIAYHTFGTLSAEGDNVIWVCHALTANSDVADWWPHTVEAGKFLDPEKYFIVCANILGSHYGTTGPLSVNPATGKPYYHTFPDFTVRDIVQVHRLLAAHLGISRVELLIGSSLGGFQCMEWALIDPDFARRVALIATTPVSKPWAAAFNESQRMALLADPTFHTDSDTAGQAGLATARSIALLSYRGQQAYDLTQADAGASTDPADPFHRKVHSYQRYQGEKLCRRFNAISYHRLTRAIDAHDVARGRLDGTLASVLGTIKAKALVVAISSDLLFPPSDHKELVEFIPHTEYHVIDSNFGHDGFLIEHEKLNAIILKFLNQ
jgi:homoserine O-acetyltransferase